MLMRLPGNGFFDPANLDFGVRPIGGTHELRAVLTNNAQPVMRIREVRFEPALGVFLARRAQGGSLTGSSLSLGEKLEISLIYSPLSEGDIDGRMVLVSGDFETELTIQASARAVAPGRPEVQPRSMNFGVVEVGRDIARAVVLKNAGETDGALTQITGDDASAFLTGPQGAPLTLPLPAMKPQEGLPLEVHFRPGEDGEQQRTLTLTFDTGETTQLPISGTGIAAGELKCGAGVVDLGGVARGLVLQREIECTAEGGPYELRGVELVAGSSSLFELRNAPTALGPDRRLRFELGFSSAGLPQRHDAIVRLTSEHGVETLVSFSATVEPPEPGTTDINLYLSWNTPYSDFDVHLVREGGMPFDSETDCYFANKSPDWGEQGYPGDDPFLDKDDTSGFGPEEVNLSFVSEDIYDVYVQYYNFSRDFAPPTTVYLAYAIRDGGQEVAEMDMLECGTLWHVGRYHFEANPPYFERIDRLSTDYGARAGCAP